MAGSSQKLMVAGALALAAALLGGGCGSPESDGPAASPTSMQPPAAEPEAADAPIPPAVAAVLSRPAPATLKPLLESKDPKVRRDAVRALGRLGGDEAVALVATMASDPQFEQRDGEACFAVGVAAATSSAAAVENWPNRVPANSEITVDLVLSRLGRTGEAAAVGPMGLANGSDDAVGEAIVRMAARDGFPESLEALFCHVRWRGRPLGPLPEELVPHSLVRYEEHRSPRGRAGIGWLGRMSKDPRLLDPLVRLTKDPEAEVRRAVALGLADGKDATARTPADADRALAALLPLGDDKDQRVVASACRAVASYDRPEAVEWLRARLKHKDFNVRVAACEGLGARKGAAAADELEAASQTDKSPSVRYAAANALAAIDAVRAQGGVDALLASEEAYVRQAGAEVLAKSAAPEAAERLARLAATDAHVRVRAAALQGLQDKSGPPVEAALRAVLEGNDPVLASVAADVAAKNALAVFLPAVRELLTRFPGTPGADAREGAMVALAKLGDESDWDRIRAVAADDPDGGVRLAAHKVIAERAKAPVPPDGADRRGVPADRLPGDAPLLRKDVLLVLETSEGTMKIRLDAEQAPIHASHVAHLARQGFYDGLTWHRVVPDFVIQGGCPRGDGSGNAGVTLPLEPTRIPFERGTLGMPRSNHPDTGGCQLFVCHSRAPHLDVKYTAFGRVVEGLDVIDRIDVGAKIVRARVEEVR